MLSETKLENILKEDGNGSATQQIDVFNQRTNIIGNAFSSRFKFMQNNKDGDVGTYNRADEVLDFSNEA